MPSAQVIDFGPDPFAESIGKFAQSFGDTFAEVKNRKRNEDIFKRIKDKYGPDVKPEVLFDDILKAEGFDQSYKKNLLDEIKDYSTLASKKDLTPYQQAMLDYKEEELQIKRDKLKIEQDNAEEKKSITPYQQELIKQRDAQLKLQQKRIEQAHENKSANLPSMIGDYVNLVFKGSEDKITNEDKALLNSITREEVENGTPLDQAVRDGIEYINEKNLFVDQAKIQEKPTGFFGVSEKEMTQALESAFNQLIQIYDNGITSQKDLKKILKNSGWTGEEANLILQRLYQAKGRKVRTNKTKTEPEKKMSEEERLADEIF